MGWTLAIEAGFSEETDNLRKESYIHNSIYVTFDILLTKKRYFHNAVNIKKEGKASQAEGWN